VTSLQVVAKGLLLGKHAYLKSGWNMMDGFLVFISLVDIAFVMLSSSQSPRIFGILRVFRLLRTLRPLRYLANFVRFQSGQSRGGLTYAQGPHAKCGKKISNLKKIYIYNIK